MKQSYTDIISRLGMPLWWDEAGVPRYEKFHPSLCNNIYARQAALTKIACQSCRHRFIVCVSTRETKRKISKSRLYYGDPPDIRCCPAGATMTSDTLELIELWQTNESFDWEKVN